MIVLDPGSDGLGSGLPSGFPKEYWYVVFEWFFCIHHNSSTISSNFVTLKIQIEREMSYGIDENVLIMRDEL